MEMRSPPGAHLPPQHLLAGPLAFRELLKGSLVQTYKVQLQIQAVGVHSSGGRAVIREGLRAGKCFL